MKSLIREWYVLASSYKISPRVTIVYDYNFDHNKQSKKEKKEKASNEASNATFLPLTSYFEF